MNILILGAGQVGSSLADILSREPENNITVIDVDEERINRLKKYSEVTALVGNASHPSVLERARIDETDVMIACTQYDEINLLACDIAKRIFAVQSCVARIRSDEYDEYLKRRDTQSGTTYQIDNIIRPEQLITEQFAQLVIHPNALQIKHFAQGKVSLVGVKAVHDNRERSMVGQRLKSLGADLEKKDLEARVVAIYRDGQSLESITGESKIEPNDEVFFLAPSEHIDEVLAEVHPEVTSPYRHIAIAGGGNIGINLAQDLEARTQITQIKIIEAFFDRCQAAGKKLGRSIVLHGNACDRSLLLAENIHEFDAFCAVTNDDENNIMSAMMARKLGARKVMALVSNNAYSELIEGDKIDVLISPSAITTSALLQYIRGADVVLVHSLRYGLAEALEVVVHEDPDKAGRADKIIGKTFEQIKLPPKVFLGAVVRGGKVHLKSNYLDKELRLQAEDHVVLFLSDKKALAEITTLFSIRK